MIGISMLMGKNTLLLISSIKPNLILTTLV